MHPKCSSLHQVCASVHAIRSGSGTTQFSGLFWKGSILVLIITITF